MISSLNSSVPAANRQPTVKEEAQKKFPPLAPRKRDTIKTRVLYCFVVMKLLRI
jgi:hypothetical protein